jgi:hypothetical protein
MNLKLLWFTRPFRLRAGFLRLFMARKKTKLIKPLPPLSDGKDSKGKFTVGNRYGVGNPLSRQVNELRVALINRVTCRDIEDIIDALIKQAKAGSVVSAREILDRCLGRPLESDILEKIETLERTLNELQTTSESKGD